MLEADFFQYYNLDIAKVGMPGLSWDRVSRLINQLPMESRFIRKKAQNLEYDWTLDQYMLALIVDQLAGIIWQNGNANVKKSKQTPKPKPLARPTDLHKPKKPSLNSREMLEALKEQKERLKIGR